MTTEIRQTQNEDPLDRIGLTADIVSAFVSNNPLPPAELPALIVGVHAALRALGGAPQAPAIAQPTPAVSVRKSITAEYLVCLEDGKRFKSLKRHLRARYDLTPEAYRARWNLPADYPMVAPAYAASRSELARAMGLGHQRRAAAGTRPADDEA